MSAVTTPEALLAELRIEKGDVTPEELAALTVVLLARAAAAHDTGDDAAGADQAGVLTLRPAARGWAMRPMLRLSARAWQTRRSLGLTPNARPAARSGHHAA